MRFARLKNGDGDLSPRVVLFSGGDTLPPDDPWKKWGSETFLSEEDATRLLAELKACFPSCYPSHSGRYELCTEYPTNRCDEGGPVLVVRLLRQGPTCP